MTAWVSSEARKSGTALDPDELCDRYRAVRHRTEALAAPLTAEDQQLQAMPESSPVKWHRAHTTWFFETFVLVPRGFAPYDERFGRLFNSYYEAMGPRHARPHRGLLSRPTVNEVGLWRRQVDDKILSLLEKPEARDDTGLASLLQLGLAHEEQHQELMVTDVLAAFACNPLAPVYLPWAARPQHERLAPLGPTLWHEQPGGLAEIGANPGPFAFDNEGPRHKVWLAPFALADRLVTVGAWTAFARDGGYTTPSLWLAEGLDWVRANGIESPAYTRREGDDVIVYGLGGERRTHPDEPILHLSFYEADALATWLGARLPTEQEWESVAVKAFAPDEATGFDEDTPEGWRPLPPALETHQGLTGLFGRAWQWTRSDYAPYPGYKPAEGAIGEYNGKFMVNQRVLRGSSAFTPPGHSRPTYRNFWHPQTRFQLTGLRLARDL